MYNFSFFSSETERELQNKETNSMQKDEAVTEQKEDAVTDKVFRTLKRRCAFNYREAVDQYWDTERELPEKIMQLEPPTDFVEYYRKYDGGGQNFTGHGWKYCGAPSVSLTLYGLEAMEEQKKKLYVYARNRVKEFEEWVSGFSMQRLDSAFRNILVIGEIGDLNPSYGASHYLVLCCSCFYLVEEDRFADFGYYEMENLLLYFRSGKDAFYDESLNGILNKILDRVLKGNETIWDLRENQKEKHQEKQCQQQILHKSAVQNFSGDNACREPGIIGTGDCGRHENAMFVSGSC